MAAALSSRLCVPRPALAPSASRRAGPRSSVRVSALSLPAEYGFVMTSVALASALAQWQAIRVGMARRKYNVNLPTMYAEGDSEEAMIFNCTQRSHQNTLENIAPVLALQMLLGLQFPRVAACLGVAWTAGRILYTLGYSTGNPAKRIPGFASSWFAYVALILATAAVGVRTVLLGA